MKSKQNFIMIEIWKPVVGYEGLYEVSNLGNLKCCLKKVKHSRGDWTRTVQEKILGNYPEGKTGYLRNRLCKNGIQKTESRHRLVAIAFIDNPNNYKDVNHKNGDKTDNRVENLEWVTRSYNIKHAYQNNLHGKTLGSKCSSAKLTEAQVLDICDMINNGMSAKEIATSVKRPLRTVYSILAGDNWSWLTKGRFVYDKKVRKRPQKFYKR